MLSRPLVLAATLAASLGLGACSTNPTNAQVGTGVGAVVGGVAGNALLGTGGAIAGAAGGALIGHELGEDRDQNQRRRPRR
jgi:osmotically inducible lipoprotein OsmB